MRDIIDRHIVMLAPKEGYAGTFFALYHHVKCDGLPLTLRNEPVFNSNAAA
jgi:hypothetical protein